MAKRKSSKTKAQSDPAVSEDKTTNSIEGLAEETADLTIDGETVPADDETPQDAAELPEGDDTVSLEGDDTVVPEDDATPEGTEDSVAPNPEEVAEDTDTTEEASDSIAAEDRDDSIAAQDGEDTIAGTEGDDSLSTQEADAEASGETTDETPAGGDDSISASVNNDSTTSGLEDTVSDQDVGTGKVEEKAAAKVHPTDAPYAAQAPEQKPRTVFPMILGGFIAAVLGFGAAKTGVLDSALPGSQQAEAPATAAPPPFDDSALTSAIDTLTTRLNDLESTVAALPTTSDTPAPQPAPEVDLSKIEAEITALSDQVKDLANQPAPEVPVPTEALDAALAELRQKASEQQAEIDRLLADQQDQIEDAEKSAKATLARTAMTAIQTALTTGTPFEGPLSELEQTGLAEVPQELSGSATDGVPSLASLIDSYPEAARSALYAARDAEKDGGLEGFLLQQLGARAVEPKEGSDPDAILSRVEAALRAGDLETALTEVQALPEPAQAAMASWTEQAQTRHNAVSAANGLAERLSAL